MIFDGLTVLQHRGQDAAGIVTFDEQNMYHRRANGYVRDIFKQRHMKSLQGSVGIGHVRYPTAGSSSVAEAQPFYTNTPFGVSLAHNGNLNNTEEQTKTTRRSPGVNKPAAQPRKNAATTKSNTTTSDHEELITSD